MTLKERLLALDAALSAVEEVTDDVLPVTDLRIWIDEHLDLANLAPDFGTFLKEQKEAVKKLAENPQVFGG